MRGVARPAGPIVRALLAGASVLTRRRSGPAALYDGLTGLPNRELFLDRLAHSLRASERRGESPIVLVIDLDGFKATNDTLGQRAGNALLAEVGRRLARCVRAEDTVARLGADEFAILLMRADEREGAMAAARLQEALAPPFVHAGQEIFPRASVGVAVGDAASGVDVVMQNADAAMCAAKESGGDTSSVFDPSEHVSILDRLALASDLRRALRHEQFVLNYQPIVSLKTQRVVGVEALARWNHPERGSISPAEFIPVAEQTGLINELGGWVLRTAIKQARLWQGSTPDLYVSVNVSVRQLRRPGLVTEVRAALEAEGLAPGSLTLEITESDLLSDVAVYVERLRALKELGVRLAIDDFGTGYSSLGYLRRLPVDVVKIDKSFVDGITTGSDEWTLALSIVRLVGALGLNTIAEGVEHAAQVAHLLALGCDAAQGFYFGRPAEAHVITNVLRERAAAS